MKQIFSLVVALSLAGVLSACDRPAGNGGTSASGSSSSSGSAGTSGSAGSGSTSEQQKRGTGTAPGGSGSK